MAKKENPNEIPKKFRKLKKSFLDHLQQDNNTLFNAFPKNLSFSGKERDENVILVVRSHWVIYFPYISTAIFILFLPLIIHIFVLDFAESISFFLAMTVSSITISLTMLIYVYLRWFYNVNIITDRRVLDLDFKSVVAHSLAEARIDRIEDITHKQFGVLGSVFDVGTLYLQTAGATAEIEFDDIYRPRDVQNILYEIMESKKKGEI